MDYKKNYENLTSQLQESLVACVNVLVNADEPVIVLE